MMYFSDIHDNALFPFRTNHILKDFKNKFPFNKPLGIDTNKKGVSTYLTGLVSHVEDYFLEDVIDNLHRPLKVDPLVELAQLQFYDDNSLSRTTVSLEDILPNEIFYSFEQLRKNIYDDTEVETRITEDEKANKIHHTFIHDKMLFDSFNSALSQLSKRHEEKCPWVTETQTISHRKYNDKSAKALLHKTRSLVLSWNGIGAGTNKVPSPEASQQSNSDDIFAPPPPIPSENERNQQTREERLNLLLTKEINEDDAWIKYEDCATQIKLDLADMILEELAMETANLLRVL